MRKPKTKESPMTLVPQGAIYQALVSEHKAAIEVILRAVEKIVSSNPVAEHQHKMTETFGDRAHYQTAHSAESSLWQLIRSEIRKRYEKLLEDCHEKPFEFMKNHALLTAAALGVMAIEEYCSGHLYSREHMKNKV